MKLSTLLARSRGHANATVIEYALIATLIGVAIVVGITALGGPKANKAVVPPATVTVPAK